MRTPAPVRALLALAALALLVPAAGAQACPGGTDTFWKNDTLPQIPGGAETIAVVQGLCEGEAAGAYFEMPGGMGTQRLTQVSVGFGHVFGTPGFQATVNVEIYEGGVTFNPNGTASLGTKVFDLNQQAATDMQIFSTGINTLDMSPYGVEVSDDFVVAFRMNFNVSFPGCPPAGAQANFFTDAFGCNPNQNLLDVQGTGWVDPATWGPLPPLVVLCPQFYAGNWVIRACTEDVGGGVGTWTDVGGGTTGINGDPTLVGSGPLTGGSTATLTLTNAAPSALMLAWYSFTSVPQNFFGGVIHATPPANQFFFNSNGAGFWTGSTTWPAGVPSGTEVWFQFLIQDFSVLWNITLSNAVKATTP